MVRKRVASKHASQQQQGSTAPNGDGPSSSAQQSQHNSGTKFVAGGIIQAMHWADVAGWILVVMQRRPGCDGALCTGTLASSKHTQQPRWCTLRKCQLEANVQANTQLSSISLPQPQHAWALQ